MNPHTRVSRARRNVNTCLIVPYQKMDVCQFPDIVEELLQLTSCYIILCEIVGQGGEILIDISTCPERIAGQPDLALCTGLAYTL